MNEQGEILYSMSEVARLLGVSREWIRQLVQRGDIASIVHDDKVRITENELQRLREQYAQGKRTWCKSQH